MRSEVVPRLLRLAAQLWTVLCGLYFLWEAFTYRGLFGRLAEFQIGEFGAYAPLLTYLFLVGITVVPVRLVIRLLARRSEKKMDEASLLDLRLTQARRLRLFLGALGATTLIVALGFFVFAAWLLPSEEGEMRTIAASEIGAVPIEEGPARVVGGELGTIIFFGQDWYVGDDRMAFSPYRPAVNGNGPARVFVQLEAVNRDGLENIVQRPVWSGIIVEGGLPGPVRVLFNHIGVGISAPYYTLYRDEYSLRIRHQLQAIQWLFLSAFLGLLVVLQTRAIRKIEKILAEPKAA